MLWNIKSLVIVLVLLSSMQLYAQKNLVNIQLKDTTVEAALNEIRNQTDTNKFKSAKILPLI